MLEQRPLEPSLRTSDELSSRHRDFAGGRLIETRPRIRTGGWPPACGHLGRNSQGREGCYQPPVDQPVRSLETPRRRARKNGRVCELAVVQHGPSAGRPTYELDAGTATQSRTVAAVSRFIAAKRDGGATPPVDAEHRLARAQAGCKGVVHGHVRRTRRRRVDKNPPPECLSIEHFTSPRTQSLATAPSA